ncbi:prepilin peptidase [Conyzicola sp.]|uniref:prepilin peptidase n=1 Tax=Conyzicola sp. TaxID=1969404 RepID=UPI0039894652
MVSLLVAGVGIVGALIGSFLNVVVWRVPRNESIRFPASHCTSCETPIRPWDNIPVVSWLLLRGRCRDCKATISWRYPAVELFTAVAFAGIALWALRGGLDVGSSVPSVVAFSLTLVAYLYLAAASISLSLIDIDTHRLPNKIVLPSYIVCGVLLVASSIFTAEYQALLTAALAGAAFFSFYLILSLGYRGGMGFGDVKLSGVLGMMLGWLGWGQVAVGAFAPFALGGIFALGLVIAGRAGRKSRIPFGPWMIVGAWVGIIAGDRIFGGYLTLFGLL